MFSSIKISLESAVSQQQIAEALDREDIEFIQTSGGLCVHASPDQLNKILQPLGAGFAITAVDESADHPPDVKAFMDSV